MGYLDSEGLSYLWNKIKNAISVETANNMLVFGDSWIAHANSVPVSNCWVYDVKDFLGCNELICYAKAGSGISSMLPDRNSVYSQAQEAISDMSADDRNKVKYIFVMGGVNDLRAIKPTATTMQNTLTTTLSTIRDGFPKAQVYVFSPDIFFETALFNQEITRSFMWAFSFACLNTGCVFLKDFTSFFVGYGQSVYRPDDDSSFSAGGGTYHPNDRGNKLIAYYVRQVLSGNKVIMPVNFETLNGFSVENNRSYTDGENLYLDFNLVIPANVSTGFVDALDMKWDGYRRCFYLAQEINGGQIEVATPQYLGNASQPTSVNGSLWMVINNINQLSRLKVFIAGSYSGQNALTLRYKSTFSIKGI